MKCYKCGKEMDREDEGSTLKGVVVTMTGETKEANEGILVNGLSLTQETIDYNNTQLGKYSDGNGRCNVGICYECYIDGLFSL